MDDKPTIAPVAQSDVTKFIEDLFLDARDARERLAESDDDDCKIKDRITCLKYLEEIVKTYMVLKKAATDDPSAAGSTVRKYTAAFTKNASGGGKKGSRRRAPAADPLESDSDGDSDAFE
jgi:hypothetical protein